MEKPRIEIGKIPDDAFVNEAGWIANLAFGEFRCVSLIWSKAGSRRSRHYHLTDSHVLYVLSGRMLYWERALGDHYPSSPLTVYAGEHVTTGPQVVHQTYFPEDTLLLSASRNARDHASHERDVIRIEEAWQEVAAHG